MLCKSKAFSETIIRKDTQIYKYNFLWSVAFEILKANQA